MADITLTTADSAGFVPQYWANRALDVLRANIVLAKTVARDVDFGEAGWRGKSITVGYPGTFVAQDKAANTPITPQVPAGGSSTTLVLNKHKVVGFSVEDFGAAQANQSLADRYMNPAVVSLTEQFETDIWAAAAQVGTVAPLGTQGTPVSSTTFRSVLQNFNTLKAPMNDRHLLLNPIDQAAILGDTNLQTYFAYSQPGVVTDGLFGQAYGFKVSMSQLAPTSYVVKIGAATAGTFTLTVGGQTASGIAFNATPAAVQTALAALSSIGAGNVSVNGAALGAYLVVLTGTAAGQAVTGSGAGLTGGSFSMSAACNTNIAYHRNAVMYACRPFEPIPASAGVLSATANDPESGLSLRVSAQYDINNAAYRINMDILYGVIPLRTNQGLSFVS